MVLLTRSFVRSGIALALDHSIECEIGQPIKQNLGWNKRKENSNAKRHASSDGCWPGCCGNGFLGPAELCLRRLWIRLQLLPPGLLSSRVPGLHSLLRPMLQHFRPERCGPCWSWNRCSGRPGSEWSWSGCWSSGCCGCSGRTGTRGSEWTTVRPAAKWCSEFERSGSCRSWRPRRSRWPGCSGRSWWSCRCWRPGRSWRPPGSCHRWTRASRCGPLLGERCGSRNWRTSHQHSDFTRSVTSLEGRSMQMIALQTISVQHSAIRRNNTAGGRVLNAFFVALWVGQTADSDVCPTNSTLLQPQSDFCQATPEGTANCRLLGIDFALVIAAGHMSGSIG